MQKMTVDKLKEIKAKIQPELDINQSDYRAKVVVHMGTCGISAGARPVMESLKEELAKSGSKDIQLTESGCPGPCSQEPMITVQLKGQSPVKYIYVDADKAKVIFTEHVLEGNIVTKHALAQGVETEA